MPKAVVIVTEGEHVAKGGANCPYCGADDPQGDEVTTGGGQAEQEMTCLECGKSWFDTYHLTGYRDNN